MSSSYSYCRRKPPHAAVAAATSISAAKIRITANDIVKISRTHGRQTPLVSDRRQLANAPGVPRADPHVGRRTAPQRPGAADQCGLHFRHDAAEAAERTQTG